ncbi:uncharacterized protein LOC122071517 [Macadamia integrifolia]|uniref:uncharacterized protein LOC122071517 n=1 Tax=Macadamia integrifolia TaxID=60698 RepID=UPI001C4FE6B7|nr:uncharacterized protein LOC122071517 [Macadamia integrifolia]
MLPLCSATPICSSHTQMYCHAGLHPFTSTWKAVELRCIMEDRVALVTPHRIHSQEVFLRPQFTKFLSHVIERPEQSVSPELVDSPPCTNELYDIGAGFSNKWSYPTGAISKPYNLGSSDMSYVESSSVPTQEDEILKIPGEVVNGANILSGSDSMTAVDAAAINYPENPLSNGSEMDGDAFSKLKTNIEDISLGFNESIDASVDKGERAVKSSVDAITSELIYRIKTATEAIENAVNDVLFFVGRTGESVANRLTRFSDDLKQTTGKVDIVAIDVLRRAIVTAEDYLAGGTAFFVYSYGSVKELLPPEVRDVLNLSEDKATEILRPAGTALEQVYIAIEVLEKNIGLDPDDPIVPFALFLGTLATLGVSYWKLTYGGYAGDLSPKSAWELLTGEKNVVLIDVRPENSRERDGVPDLRRGARYRYASISPPQIGGSVTKLVKSGRDLDDAIIAAVIRNLKILQDRSNVILMDVDGTHSKGIARSLRKLGVKKPYRVQGGFRSWAKDGLRIKDLKPETTFTILNEEAEAILEDIKPTPVQVIGYGVGLVASLYALLEWEKTLQLIGVVGLGQTIYQRVASYEDPEDFKQDNWQEAYADGKWKVTMVEEMGALKKNDTWELVTLPSRKRPIGCKYVFVVKQKLDRSVDKCKARLVAKRFTQTYGIDYQETFALRELDKEYMDIPQDSPVRELRARSSDRVTILIVYVDDIVVTRNDSVEIGGLKSFLGRDFEIKDLGKLRVEAYTNADWAGPDKKSISGCYTFVGGNLVTWRSKKQNVVARSNAEAEFRAMA